MPKATPVLLHPLNFDEVIKALMGVDPGRVGLGSKRAKSESQRKRKPSRKPKQITKTTPK